MPAIRAVAPALVAPATSRPAGLTVLERGVSVETLGGVATSLIPSCQTLPAAIMETFSTAEDNQQRIEIHLLSGDAARAAENRSLGRFTVYGIPEAPRGVPVIEVSVAVDREGVLRVTALDRETGAQHAVAPPPAAR